MSHAAFTIDRKTGEKHDRGVHGRDVPRDPHAYALEMIRIAVKAGVPRDVAIKMYEHKD